MELSWEEFWDNLCLRYGLMPQDISATYNGCGKRFSIEHSLSCPNDGLVLAQHDDAAKDWGALGSRALVPSAITYEPKIKSRTVQGERTGYEARQESKIADGGADKVRESQGGQWNDGEQSGYISRDSRTGAIACRVEGRRKRPRLLEAGDHRDVWH